MVEDGEFVARADVEPLHCFIILHPSQFLDAGLHEPQLVRQHIDILNLLIHLLSFGQQIVAHDFVEEQVPSFEGLIKFGHSMHLVVVGPIHQAVLAPYLLTHLAKDGVPVVMEGA